MAAFRANAQNTGDPLMDASSAVLHDAPRPDLRASLIVGTCELSQRFFFDAAHTLHRTTETEGSLRVHGHTYHAEITVSGVPDERSGMIIDLGYLRQHIARVRHQLD